MNALTILVCLSLLGIPSAEADNPFFSNDSGTQIGSGWHGPHILGGKDGILYLVTGDHRLHWYRADRLGRWDVDNDLQESWANGSGNVVGTGWDAAYVFGGYDGVIYMVDWEGQLKWYKRQPGDAENWHPKSGTVIGAGGWRMSKVFGGKDGVIYAVEDGNLIRYKHLGDPDQGINGWEASSETVIGTGWDQYDMLEADAADVILARTPNGDLYYNRWDPDEERWLIEGRKIGAGWGEFSSIHMGPNGYIYAQRQDGALLYYEIIKAPRALPLPVQQLADLPHDTGFVARNLHTGKFLRAQGDYLLATSDFDEATPLAMGQSYNSRRTQVFNEVQYYPWNQSSFRVFALRTADGADIVPHEQSLGLAFGLVTGVDPGLVGSASLIRQESPGRFSVWVFDLGWDKHIYSLIACDTPYGCGRPRMPKPTQQQNKILYANGADSGTGDWELLPVSVNVQAATPPDPRYARLPKIKQATAFDGATSQNLGTHSLPPTFAVDIYARIDQSQQWDHLIEVGTVEHGWNGPLRLEVGNEGEWYVSVGDGTRYTEATFDGGWSYGEDLHIRFRYDSNSGIGIFEQYDAGSGGFRQLGTLTGGPDVTHVEGTAIIGSMEGTSRFFRGTISSLEVWQTFD